MFKSFLLVGFGGMIGSMLRYAASTAIKSNHFPYNTLLINIVGSFCIGLVMAFVLKNQQDGNLRLFFATGICGGFTTFSAFSWENLQLLQQQKYVAAICYIVFSILMAIIATFVGFKIVK